MDAMNCEAAMNFCDTELSVPFFNTGASLASLYLISLGCVLLGDPYCVLPELTECNTGRNPYDISIDCDGPIAETLCYPVTKYASFNFSRKMDR